MAVPALIVDPSLPSDESGFHRLGPEPSRSSASRSDYLLATAPFAAASGFAYCARGSSAADGNQWGYVAAIHAALVALGISTAQHRASNPPFCVPTADQTKGSFFVHIGGYACAFTGTPGVL
jgi:hypothetical protein